ncbi:MAG: S8 family peptidase [Pseudomonadota bacterium]
MATTPRASFLTATRRALPAIVFSALAAGAGLAQAQPTGAQPFGASAPIAGRYIVVLNDSAGNPAAAAARMVRAAGAGAQLHHSYTTAIRGFAATLPDAAVQALRNNPQVASIEQDQTVSLNQTQTPATWGLDRIDETDRLLNGQYTYTQTGAAAYAFIVDTGIRSDHQEFAGRVQAGATAISDGRGTEDCNGHGTHVAGTVGGSTWGVAKQVTLVPVRVLNCRGSGSWSGIIAGLDYVAQDDRRPAVANLSLGGGYSATVNAAVAGAVANRVTVVVAAGNSAADACQYSPASEPSALTIGATTNADAGASYSNYGACLDLFAPGSAITSAWYTSSSATNTISGTSMASPHVAGVAALVLGANPTASPAAVGAFIAGQATPGRLTAVGTGSPNLLLYSLLTGTPAEPPAQNIAVGSLSGVGLKSGKNWRARVTVAIQDKATSLPVGNVTVQGVFSTGGTGSCLTSGTGVCSITSATLSTSVGATQFSVTGVIGNNMTYVPATGGDWVIVNRP